MSEPAAQAASRGLGARPQCQPPVATGGERRWHGSFRVAGPCAASPVHFPSPQFGLTAEKWPYTQVRKIARLWAADAVLGHTQVICPLKRGRGPRPPMPRQPPAVREPWADWISPLAAGLLVGAWLIECCRDSWAAAPLLFVCSLCALGAGEP